MCLFGNICVISKTCAHSCKCLGEGNCHHMNISAYSSGNQTKTSAGWLKVHEPLRQQNNRFVHLTTLQTFFSISFGQRIKKKKTFKIPLNGAQFSKLSYFVMEDDKICDCQAGDINSIRVKEITFLGWNDVNKTPSQWAKCHVKALTRVWFGQSLSKTKNRPLAFAVLILVFIRQLLVCNQFWC